MKFKLPLSALCNSDSKIAEEASFKVALLSAGDSTALLQNAILSIKKVGIPAHDIIVGRFHSDMGNDELASTGVTMFFLETLGFTTPPKGLYAKYGSADFSDLMNIRFLFLKQLLRCGHLIICSDVDVVWFRNPIPLLRATMRNYDWASQVEPVETSPPSFCNGFVCIKPSRGGIEILEQHHLLFLLTRKSDPRATTQPVFVQLLEKHPNFLARIFPLSEVLFPAGLSYRLFDTNNPQDNLVGHLKPFIFHANWTIGEETKIQLLKRVNGWHLSDK